MQQSQKKSTESRSKETSVFSHLDKTVYTAEGRFVGMVDEIMVSFEEGKVVGYGLRDCNNALISNTKHYPKVQIASELVISANDILLITPVGLEGLNVRN